MIPVNEVYFSSLFSLLSSPGNKSPLTSPPSALGNVRVRGSSITPDAERGFLRDYQQNLDSEVSAMLRTAEGGQDEGEGQDKVMDVPKDMPRKYDEGEGQDKDMNVPKDMPGQDKDMDVPKDMPRKYTGTKILSMSTSDWNGEFEG